MDLFHSGPKVASSQVKMDVAEVVKLMLKVFLVPHIICSERLMPYSSIECLLFCLPLLPFFCAFGLHASKTPSNRSRINKSLVCSGLSGHISMQKLLAMAAESMKLGGRSQGQRQCMFLVVSYYVLRWKKSSTYLENNISLSLSS